MKKLIFISLVLFVNIAFGQTMIRLSQIEPVVVSNTGTSTDKAIAKFNGTNGRVIQNSGVTIDDSNNIREASSLFFYNNVYQLGTSGQLDINPYSTLRLGRETNNANFSFQIFKGDNTATVNHYFKGNGNSYLSANNGYLGIGLTNPLAKLHVYDATSSGGGRIMIGTNSVGQSTNLGSKFNVEGGTGGGYASYWAMDAYFDEATSTWLPLRTTLGNKFKIEQSYHKAAIVFSYANAVQNPIAWTDAMIIKNTGNILINTPTDNGVDKIQVNGTISGSNATLSNQAVMLGQLSISDWNSAYGWGNWASNFGTTAGTIAQGNDSRIANGQTAYGWGNHSGLYRLVSYVPAWSEITSKPTFATVATSGSYNDLTGIPATFAPSTHTLDSHSNISITSNSAGEILKWNGSAWINNTLAEAGIQAAGSYQPLASVLTNTTASFTTAQETKLSGIAAGAEVNVNADWNSVSGDAQILNKPTIPTNTNQLTNGAGFITTEIDGSVSNEGVLGVTSSGISKSVLLSTNTSGASGSVFTAGNGLTISGAYQADGGSVTFGLGTPSNLSPTSTNSASGDTHTHSMNIYGTPTDGNTLKYSTTYGFAWGSSVTGTGSSGRVALWSGTDTQTSDADYLFNSTTNVLTVGSGSGNGYVISGNFANSSDKRLKERIRNIENLDWVDEIEFKNFEFKGDISDRLRYGVIAQEIKKINPELVYNDENGFYAVGYIDLLIAKVSRQDEIINELIKRIEKLENEK